MTSGVPEDGSEQVDLGGVTGHRKRVGDACALEWAHRPFDENDSEDIRSFAKALLPQTAEALSARIGTAACARPCAEPTHRVEQPSTDAPQPTGVLFRRPTLVNLH
jgi:hypothetical protein